MKNKKPLKISEEFYDFLLRLGANRVKVGMELQTLNLCDLPDTIVKYFKANNDRYLELAKVEVKNGNK